MAEREEGGLLRVVVVLGLIAVIAFSLIFGLQNLRAKMDSTNKNTTDMVQQYAESSGEVSSGKFTDNSGLHVSLRRIGKTVTATYSGDLTRTGSGTWVAQLPNGYYPTQDTLTDVNASGMTMNLMARSNGRIAVWDKGATGTKTISGTATWQTNDAMPSTNDLTFIY